MVQRPTEVPTRTRATTATATAALGDPATGLLRSEAEIRALFADAGLDFSVPAVASCGSGVTACALVFALHLLGKDDVAVYDGAWAEWGLPGETPVELGGTKKR